MHYLHILITSSSIQSQLQRKEKGLEIMSQKNSPYSFTRSINRKKFQAALKSSDHNKARP